MTPEQLKAIAQAQAIMQAASAMQSASSPAPNPDGTFGTPPPGMVLNPATGQMEDLRSPVNPNIPQGALAAAGIGAGQGIGYGTLDEAVGGLNAALGSGGTAAQRYAYDAAAMREAEQRAASQNPGAYYPAAVAGAVASPVSRVLGPTNAAPSIGARIVDSAASGAAMGGAYGFGAGEGGLANRADSATSGAEWGGALGAVTPLVTAPLENAINRYLGRRAIAQGAAGAPSIDGLRSQADAAYGAVDNAGLSLAPASVQTATNGIVDSMVKNGLDTGTGPLNLTPQAARVAQIISEAGADGQPVPFSALEQMRRKAGIAASNFTNKGDQALGSQAVGGIDNYIAGLTPADAVSGDPAVVQQNIVAARDMWGRLRRSEAVQGIIDNAQNYASGFESGVRNGFSKLLKNPNSTRGFSDAELQAMRDVVNKSPVGNIITQVGKMGFALHGGSNALGATGGLGAGAAIGGMVGGPPGAALGAAASSGIGTIARLLSEAQTAKGAETVRALVANGGLKSLPTISPIYRSIAEQMMRSGGTPIAGQ